MNSGADIVLSHSAIPNVYARLTSPVPVVTVLHSASDDFADRTLRVAERLLRRRTPAVVAVADSQLATYKSRFRSAPTKLVVIPNGIPSEWAMKAAVSPAPSVVGTVARFAWQKRPDRWLELAWLAREALPQLVFRWWGPIDTSDPRISDLLAQSWPSNAELLEPTDDPNSTLASVDIMVSTADREAHSIALLEAAATGLVIVAPQSILGATAAHLPAVVPYETANVRSALESLRQAATHWRDISERAHGAAEHVGRSHSLEAVADAYLTLFKEILHER